MVAARQTAMDDEPNPPPSLAELLPPDAAAVAKRFGVDESAILGIGSESVVFALDDERVLRLPRGETPGQAYRERLRAFLADLDGRLPYATPVILDIADGDAFTVERRIAGRPMAERLVDMPWETRDRAWRAYVVAVDKLRTIRRPEHRYTQLVAPEPISAATWPEFVARCMDAAAGRNRLTIEREVGPAGELLERAIALTKVLETSPPHALVHGDIFPGNMMMDDDGNVTGLLDFGVLTVAGDPALDLAGAYLPLEMLAECEPADAGVVRSLMVDHYGEEVAPPIACYRAWYALFLADPAYARAPYPRLYDWSLANLRRLARDETPDF